MAIDNKVCNVLKEELFKGSHNFATGTFKIALYQATATVGATTANYAATSNEVANGSGYTTTGKTLTGNSVVGGTGSATAYVTWSNAEWTSSSFSSAGALIYNTEGTLTNNAVCSLSFGGTFTSANGTFTVQFPTAGGGSEILRLTSS
jgi:hypothetical protein